jgi:hypothetical protein
MTLLLLQQARRKNKTSLPLLFWISSISLEQRIGLSSSWQMPTIRRGMGQCLTSFAWRTSSTTTWNTKDSTCIRMSADLPDFDMWEAFIPNLKQHPSLLQLHGQIIMFKGPSRPFWLRSIKRSHENPKKIKCEVTKKAHEKVETVIKDERLFPCRMIVFKPGTVLDNSIFSNNNTDVLKNELSMKMKADEADNKFDILICGMGLWWRIAEAGGEVIRNQDSKVNAKSLLLD